MHRSFLMIGAAILVCAQLTSADSSALINKALDQQVKITVDTTLPQALKAITKQTDVPLVAEESVWELLPRGEDTEIKARIEGKTLREALELITRKLGLTFTLKEEAVEVQPMPALRRLARRSTVREIEALDFLAGTPLNLSTDRTTVKQLIDAVDARLVELKSPFAVEIRVADAATLSKPVGVARNASMADALEAMTAAADATWYPWDRTIVITSKESVTQRKLDRIFSANYRGKDLQQALIELSNYTGVPFEYAPGAVAQVQPEARQITGFFKSVPAKDVLEAISASTGLRYQIKEDKVLITGPTGLTGIPARDPIVGIIPLDNGMWVMLRESQVPPELREYLAKKKKDGIDKRLDDLRKLMQEEGFKPTTKPATNPDSL